MRKLPYGLLIAFLILLRPACKQDRIVPQIIIHNKTISELDSRVFGQFLEKPSWHGEWGPEAALIPGTNKLQDGVFHLMDEMNIPVVRFPGGTDVNFQDWTTMIDNVPGYKTERPIYVGQMGDTVTNRFGYDEACRLTEKLGSEMMLVINFGDAYFKRKPLKEAVMHEAGLLAYCNLEVGTELPAGMPDWPALRAKNGHPEPYGVKYIQIANEPWVMDRELKQMSEIAPEIKENYFTCLGAFIDTFKAIDPEIQIIADGNIKELTLPLKEMFGDKIDYLSYHIYLPWGIKKILKDDLEITGDSITNEDIWKAWTAVPQINEEGMSVIENKFFKMVESTGYPIAVTEWNWNGWWGTNSVDQDNLGSQFTKGFGAAGFIHGLMRQGNKIALANQSMLIGKSWGITGIRVSPTMEFAPHPYPTGQVTGLYSRNHGNQILEITHKNLPVYEQPYKMNDINSEDKVAYLDILASYKQDTVYLHVINRHFSEEITIDLDLIDFEKKPQKTIHKIFKGNLKNTPCKENSLQIGWFEENENRFNGEISFPERTVSIVVIPLE